MSLIGRLREPRRRGCLVFGHPLAVVQAHAEVALGVGVALIYRNKIMRID